MNNNIKLFDIFTSAILNKLYTHFPKCIEISPDEEVEALNPRLKKLKEYRDSNFTEKSTIYSETLFWLRSNDYVDFIYPEKRPQVPANISQFDCVELTREGLKLLKSLSPKSLIEGETVGDEIKDNLRAGLLNEAGQVASDAILY